MSGYLFNTFWALYKAWRPDVICLRRKAYACRKRCYEWRLFRNTHTHCRYLDIYISQDFRLCKCDFESQFQTVFCFFTKFLKNSEKVPKQRNFSGLKSSLRIPKIETHHGLFCFEIQVAVKTLCDQITLYPIIFESKRAQMI